MSRNKAARKTAPAETTPAWNFWESHARRLALVLVLVGTFRITATYDEMSHTIDEPAHIACGMEWLSKHTYSYEAQHPPLTRIMAALLPYLNGAASMNRKDLYAEGAAIVYGGMGYESTLAHARAGMLPFFWIGCLAVYVWGERYFSRLTALLATALYTFLPSILGHGGLATTDMGLTSLLCGALLATVMLVEQPNLTKGALWGFVLGLAICAKFSALAFYPCANAAAFLLCLVWNRRTILARAKQLALPALAGATVCFFVIWAMYRFSIGPTSYAGFPLPFPELFQGIDEVRNHQKLGHISYLFGTTSKDGFWYYYPAAVLFKLPLALIALAAVGKLVAWRQRHLHALVVLAFATGIFFFAMTSRINIGTRHIAPVMLLTCLIAAAGAEALLKSVNRRIVYIATGMLLWYASSSILIHPHYIAYFNELAGSQPESILVDSDLDWGQDTARAGRRLRELNAPYVIFNPFTLSHLEAHGYPQIGSEDPDVAIGGWHAVSMTVAKIERFRQKDPNKKIFPETMPPTERIGQGMALYYIPPTVENTRPITAP